MDESNTHHLIGHRRCSSTEPQGTEMIPTKIRKTMEEVTQSNDNDPGSSMMSERIDICPVSDHQEKRPLEVSTTHWYFISVWHNSNCSRAKLMKILCQYTGQLSLEVFLFYTRMNRTTFVIDNYAVANMLKFASIFNTDGTKLFTEAKTFVPSSSIRASRNLFSIIEKALAQRYDAERNLLNLQKFHKDKRLLASNLFCPLNAKVVVNHITKILRKSRPRVRELNLSDNYLSDLKCIEPLLKIFPDLISLNLEGNKITEISELSVLKKYCIPDLCLERNEICCVFQTQEDYIRSILTELPNIRNLNNKSLMNTYLPAISTNMNSSTTKVDHDKEIFAHFIKYFYMIFDSQNLDELQQIYKESAIFLLYSVQRCPDEEDYHGLNVPYIRKEGKRNIIEVLSGLPKTKHDFTSLKIDFCYIDCKSAKVKVAGLFIHEGLLSEDPLQFERVFTMEKNHVNLVFIKRDHFTVFRPAEIMMESSNECELNLDPGALIINPDPRREILTGHDQDHPQDMLVHKLAHLTGMNYNWSQKCLSETGWNLDNAMAAYNRLKGTIPAEAFN